MYNIAIFGTENSHSRVFTRIFNSGKYPDMVVKYAGGTVEESNADFKKEFPDVEIVNDPKELVGKVDAAMITNRDGKYHAEFARPFIEAGIPVFVDKPLTCNVEEAIELVNFALEKKAPITGGSSLKHALDVRLLKNFVDENRENITSATLVAPSDYYSEYSGFWFYSPHLVEMTLNIFGYDPIEVTALEHNGNVTVVTKYKDFLVTNQFGNDAIDYFGQVVIKNKLYSREIDTALIFEGEVKEFVDMVHTGELPYTPEQLVMPVRYIDAVIKSYETKTTVKIEY